MATRKQAKESYDYGGNRWNKLDLAAEQHQEVEQQQARLFSTTTVTSRSSKSDLTASEQNCENLDEPEKYIYM